jgi:hypothetical protein
VGAFPATTEAIVAMTGACFDGWESAETRSDDGGTSWIAETGKRGSSVASLEEVDVSG